MELLSNKKKTEAGEVDIKAPAFSVTKVSALLGGVIAALLAALPSTVRDDEQILIASIASATVIVLGIIGLAAVDIVTRQRAHEAKLRYSGGDAGDGEASNGFLALPKNKKLVLQKEHSDPEYEVDALRVGDGEATLIATRDGDTHTEVFQNPEKPK